MVESNVGLGSALAEGTSLRGDFGNPISRGMQLNMQNDFAQLQQEQAKQAKLAKVEEDIAKFSSIDSGQWYDQERGRKVKKYIDENMAKAIEAKRSGNAVEAERIKQQIKNEVTVQKGVDTDHKALMTASDKSVTKPRALKLYNTGGVGALDAENKKHFFAPVAQIDMESGSFKINNVDNPRLDNILKTKISEQIKNLPTTKLVKGGQGEIITEVDPDSLEYKAAKQNVIDSIVENDDLVDKIVYTQDFIDYYDKYLEKNNLGEVYEEDEDAPKIVEDALRGFVEEKYKLNEGKKVRYKSISSGGSQKSYNPAYYKDGKNKGRFTFVKDTESPEGFVKVNVEGKTGANTVFSGTVIKKDAKTGAVTTSNIQQELYEPRIRYLGNDIFEVMGSMKLSNGIYSPIASPIRISKNEVENVFGLTEQGMKDLIGYKPKGAAPKAQGKKESYPSWKAKNPSGTPAQYKTYLKS